MFPHRVAKDIQQMSESILTKNVYSEDAFSYTNKKFVKVEVSFLYSINLY